MKYRIFFSLSIAFLIIGCHTAPKNESTYFGGKIKNPKDKKVTLFKADKEIATTEISQDHKFLFKLDSLQSGLYRFKHGEEIQYIYLENKDSLLIRLNTWDFDGSLVFSGKGANRNNFLIQLFLENEQEDREFYSFFRLEEKEFSSKADSLIAVKKRMYEQFKENTVAQSIKFDGLVNTIIYYPIYAKKEEYPVQYKHFHKKEKLPKISPNFYSHRKEVSKNTFQFKDYYTYKNYLWNKIYNISLYQVEQDTLSNLSSMLLQQISKLVFDENLKNNMLQQTFINSLFDSSCSDIDKEKTKHLFFEKCNDNTKKEKVSEILKVINTLQKNTKLPEFYIKNTQDKISNTKSLIGKNMVIYFWPKELNRIHNMTKRVHFLVNKYPNINFIGIDGQLNNKHWKSIVKNNRLDYKNQYQLVNQTKNIFYTNDFPRAIIINKKGIIQNNFTLISQHNFEKLLLSLEN